MEKVNKKIDPSVLIRLTFMISLFAGIYFLGNTGQLDLLINPRYFILIAISLFILLIYAVFLFSELLISADNTSGKRLLGKKYFLFLVIIILMMIFKFTPNYNAYYAAVIKMKGLKIQHNQPAVQPAPGYTEKNDIESNRNFSDPEKIIFFDENFIDLLDNIHQNIDNVTGKTAVIRGFVFKIEDMGRDHFVIARMAMICCAADASVIGFVCNQQDIDQNFAENDWYELESIITKETVKIYNEERDLPVFRIIKFKKTDKMDNPYVYPAYNYN